MLADYEYAVAERELLSRIIHYRRIEHGMPDRYARCRRVHPTNVLI